MLRAFGHPVGTCCDMSRHVGCCWLKFEAGKIFHAAFVNVACCCGHLARFVQKCYARACALVRFSIPNMWQHVAIMDKSLGTNLHLWRFFTRIHLHLFSPSFHPPPPPYNVGHMYTLFLQSFNIVLGGGGGEATHYETHNCFFKTPF